MANTAEQLFDQVFALNFLREKILPLYPDFTDIKKLKINRYKDHMWAGNTYHIVVEYRTDFVDKTGQIVTLPIFCSAHSDEPRENVFRALKFLWNNGFGKGNLTIPHALYFSHKFKGTFYRGVEGHNLYYYIRKNDKLNIERIIPKAARWFAKLHGINTVNVENFNKENSRIETVYPGIDHILHRIKEKYPKYYNQYKKIYALVNDSEKKFLAEHEKKWLVHGDAHPENIIKMSENKTAVIDFTDLCLSDFARDLGSFVQQLEFMTDRKIADQAYSKVVTELFIDSYFSNSNENNNEAVKLRMKNYYCWTAMRTATFFLIKDKPEPERAYPLIEKASKDLGI